MSNGNPKKGHQKMMGVTKHTLLPSPDIAASPLKKKVEELESLLTKSRVAGGSFKKKVLSRTEYLQHLNQELEAVFQVSSSLISFPDFSQVLELLLRMISDILKVDACSVRLYYPEKKILVTAAVMGFYSECLKKISFRLGEGISGLALKDRRTVIVNDVLRDERTGYPRELASEGFRAAMCVPILFFDEPLGALTVYVREPRVFTENQKKLLATFASQTALAIKNARLHENAQKEYLNTINALIMTMEARHSYTRGHSERVTRYALEIARSVRLSEEEIEIIRYTGKLHDIGKIAIPDQILDKPGKLTVAERAQIELHTIRGAEMLEPLQFLQDGLCIVRNHHERYDGKGYPDGLIGESIPAIARAVALADAFDAMTTDRAYRKAMSVPDAVFEIERNAGTQFDPQMAGQFLALLNQVAA
ncbi:MAG: HD-GYP domain-containing protein [Candidatus Omnitrophota bacterium]